MVVSEREERWQRYNRYVRGERNDGDEPFLACKMLAAVSLSMATMFGLCLFVDEFTTHFKGIDEEDDDCQRITRDESLVKAYYNPVTENWERVFTPFAVPAPSSFLAYYRDLDDDDFDEDTLRRRLPRDEFPVLEMPFSHTKRPSILYDPRSCKMVVFKD
ncbi:hypothetical protein X943_001711 [Babesia divergens]|uniref:Uncharacterized protein n=1 Tax=Babesia divergens TaxID=32595 RepID=A0AAD9GAI3_BABDI|nr:hypothetical protein X943_001711 [Babesia divergens]